MKESISNIIFYWDGGMSKERKKILDDALYSARLHNPTRPIYLVSNTVTKDQLDPAYNIFIDKWDESIYEPLESLPNINQIKQIYKNVHARERSDLFRLLLLYKYGGTYVDTDDISIRPLPEYTRLINSFCSSYDPHTCHYSSVGPEDCVPGDYRELKGYEHINMFPRNDCWVNFEPKHFMIKQILFDKRFTERNTGVHISDEFSWQRLTLEIIKNNIDEIGLEFNFTLNLLYLYESHVAFCSHWDMCLNGGPVCDVWPIDRSHENWGNYRTNETEALDVFRKMLDVYEFAPFLWLHDKCGNPEWQIDDLEDNKDYLISTYILNNTRRQYKSLSLQIIT
jgi:hypothetical protein